MVMFNRVLKQFTLQSLGEKIWNDSAKTWHSWVYKWWQDANRGSNWKLPEIERMTPDFLKAMGLLDRVTFPRKLGWSNLIIDEGQDFPQEFYLLLNCIISNPMFHNARPPALTVLADENQRLDPSRNSTVNQIVAALGVPPDCVYKLSKNFRNTKEIAELARVFHTGNGSDLPELPTRSGPKPALVKFTTFADEIDQIFRYAKNNEDLEIGVFLSDQAIQRRVYLELEGRCRQAGLLLQYYSSIDKDNLPVFDTKGSITLLCGKSVKGVEFDTVFVPQLTKYRTDGINAEFVKMNFYVLSTRARKQLQFSYTDATLPPDILKIFSLAGPNVLERK
jgi:superfamily I DNA/RNA helicase